MAVFLVLGAIVNVGVAWGCALFADCGPSTKDSVKTGPATWENRLTSTGPGITIRGRLDGNVRVDATGVGYFGPAIESSTTALAGWPLRSMCCEYPGYVVVYSQNGSSGAAGQPIQPRWGVLVSSNRVHRPIALPLRPVALGFTLNTFVYAIVAFLAFSFIIRPLLALPFGRVCRDRLRRGLCPQCAYDLRGTNHAVCPECGKAVATTIANAAPNGPHP